MKPNLTMKKMIGEKEIEINISQFNTTNKSKKRIIEKPDYVI